MDEFGNQEIRKNFRNSEEFLCVPVRIVQSSFSLDLSSGIFLIS